MDLEKLSQIVNIRGWNWETQEEYTTSISLINAVKNPYGLNMADLGWHLTNIVREELKLYPLSENSLSK